MKFWKSLQFTDTEDLLDIAKLIDTETAFHGAYLGDHWVSAHESATKYPTTPDGRPPFPPDTHWPHLAGSMGAMLGATRNMHVSVSVMILPLYNTFDIARMCGTLALMSNDRLSLGVSAGWSEEEFVATGVDFASRGRRVDEMIDVLRLLMSGEKVEYHGEFHDFNALSIEPRPMTPVPLLTGGFSARALRRAVEKSDGWVGAPLDQDHLVSNIRAVTRMLEETGRPRDRFEIRAPFRGDDVAYLHRLADLGVDSILCTPPATHFGTRQAKQEKIDDMYRTNDVISKFIDG